jgi:ADP-ribose pyrophosphatase YjhB (NUDIX family)
MEVKNSYAGVIINDRDARVILHLPEYNELHGELAETGNNKFLVAHHIKKTERPWRFPGGKIEANELPIMAAARELQEELGVVALSLRLHNVQSQQVDGKLWMGFYFVCDEYTGTLKVQEPDKLPEFRFCTLEELKSLGSHYEADMVKNL